MFPKNRTRRTAHVVAAALLFALLLPLLTLPMNAASAAGNSGGQGTLPASLSVPTLALPGLSAECALLMDASDGRVLYEKDARMRRPMASTTKIMTALCAVELAEDTSCIVAVDPAAVGIEGSSVYLYAGEELTLEQLLYALLLESANDAATAIAIATAGSVEAFADRMNDKAAALGLTDTHFTNPHGLHDDEHYTTAYDLAVIARAALANETLRKIFSTRKTTIPLNGTKGVRLLLNHNKMLKYYDGAIGVKTGFTKKSGRCLVSAAERDGLTLIAVTLNAPDDWNDHTRMLDAGFGAYESVTLCGTEEFRTAVPVAGGVEEYVLVQNACEASITLPRERGNVVCTVELPHFLYAPVGADESVGELVFSCTVDGERTEIARVPLRTLYGVERRAKKTLWQKILAFFGWDRK